MLATSAPEGHPGAAYWEKFGEARTLLIVDDNIDMLENVRRHIQTLWSNWTVVHQPGETEARYWLARNAGTGHPHLVSVDLGLEPDPDHTTVGLKLLRHIHAQFSGLPLAVHSSLQVSDEALHEILTIPASYIAIKDPDAGLAFAAVLPLLARGFLVYSPRTASRFPEAVANVPDPLEDTDWKLLKLLTEEPPLSYRKIGERIGLGEQGVMGRIKKMALALNALGFIQIIITQDPDPYRYRPHLKGFYEQYHVRYTRP